jgi:hypothetical protein
VRCSLRGVIGTTAVVYQREENQPCYGWIVSFCTVTAPDEVLRREHREVFQSCLSRAMQRNSLFPSVPAPCYPAEPSGNNGLAVCMERLPASHPALAGLSV